MSEDQMIEMYIEYMESGASSEMEFDEYVDMKLDTGWKE